MKEIELAADAIAVAKKGLAQKTKARAMHKERATNVLLGNKSVFHRGVNKDGHAPVDSSKALQTFSLMRRHRAQICPNLKISFPTTRSRC